MASTLLEVTNLSKMFPITKGLVLRKKVGEVHAVSHVSFEIGSGETLSIVGESGSGKTTIAKMVGGLLRPSSGKIVLDGHDIWSLKRKEQRKIQQKVGFVFQDPFVSLNPRMKIQDVVSEPLAIHHWKTKDERMQRVKELLKQVGLSASDASKYPHQFSGGQLQRIAIARALSLGPSLIIADEPVSALDVSVQAKIVNLMYEIQRDIGVSYLLISHDLGVVKHISNRVIMLYLGHIMEQAEAERFVSDPLHPYSQALISSVLIPNVEELKKNPPKLLSGEIPSPVNLPKGCKFSTRCPYVQPKCKVEQPELLPAGSTDHLVSCFYWNEIKNGGASAEVQKAFADE